MNIYVGNLSYEVSEGDLQQAFEVFGRVESVDVIKDNFSGKSKGFGFVVMPEKKDADTAINGLNEKMWKGRTLKVNEARTDGPKDRKTRSAKSQTKAARNHCGHF